MRSIECTEKQSAKHVRDIDVVQPYEALDDVVDKQEFLHVHCFIFLR